ncbi:flavodoxin family protein [Candidatus Omnitrophota bacterium]
MTAIIIYYSYSGNTKKVADVLSSYLGNKYEVAVSRLEAPEESSSFAKQAVRALLRKRVNISNTETDLSSYDLICLGTPVWAFAPAPAMNTYLDQCAGLDGKQVAIFTTYGSGTGVSRCVDYMCNVLSKKGAKDSKVFSIQQAKVNDEEFVKKVISKNIE